MDIVNSNDMSKITLLGIDNNLVSYKLTTGMYDEVKYVLGLIYRLREQARSHAKKLQPQKYVDPDNICKPKNQRTPIIYLPINLDHEKNSVSTLNLIEDLIKVDANFVVIKLREKVAQDLVYGLKYVYKKRLSCRVNNTPNKLESLVNNKRSGSRKKNHDPDDYF